MTCKVGLPRDLLIPTGEPSFVATGAGLDVFEREPVAADNPFLTMHPLMATPHSLCWTDHCFRDIASDGLDCPVDLSNGKAPKCKVPA